MAVGTSYALRQVQKKEQQMTSRYYNTMASGIYEAVHSAISTPLAIAQTMANDTFLIRELEQESTYTEQEMISQMSQYLSALKETFHTQSAFVVSDASKRYYSYDGLNKVLDLENDPHDIWYSIFINNRKKLDFDIDVDELNNNAWTLFVNCRIESQDGTYLGVCGIGISMEDLQQVLAQYETTYDLQIQFVNADGTPQLDTTSVNIEDAHLHDVLYNKDKDGYAYQQEDGSYVVMRYVEELNWYLVIQGTE